MTNESTHMTHTNGSIPFGARLKAAREALNLEHKDIASQLRLNEMVVKMMENDKYPHHLPNTFIRGYLKSYGKLLQIPEHELNKAVDLVRPNASTDIPLPIKPVQQNTDVTTSHLMRYFTFVILFILVGLIAIGWYT